MAQDYSFLNSYITGLVNQEAPDEQELQDDSDLYEVTPEEDEYTKQDTGDYGIDPDEDEYNSDDDDTPYEYHDPMEEESYSGGEGAPAGPSAPGGLGRSIAGIESGGKYTAKNKHSSAVGKYQFLWSAWGDSIKKVTGVGSKDEFLHSPQAQEKYYAWYEKHYLMPQVAKLQQYNKAGLSDQQLAKLVHYRGAGGAKKYLLGQMKDQPEKYNVPISQYLGSKRLGGAVAMSAQAQHEGLNNDSFESMYFPMSGENEFRGLDNGDPVYLEDEKGKKKVLRGRRDRARMHGNVFEKRLK